MGHICLDSTLEYEKETEEGLANAFCDFTKVYIGVNKDGYVSGISDAYSFEQKLMEDGGGHIKKRVELVTTNNLDENVFYPKEVPSAVANKPENLILRNRDQEAERVMVSLGYSQEQIQKMFEIHKKPGMVRNYLVITIPGRQGAIEEKDIESDIKERIKGLAQGELRLYINNNNRRLEGNLATDLIRVEHLSQELLGELRESLKAMKSRGSLEPHLEHAGELPDEEMLKTLGFVCPVTSMVNRAGASLFFSEPNLVNSGEMIKVVTPLWDQNVVGPLTQAVDKTLDILYGMADQESLEKWDKGLKEVLQTLLYIAYVQKELQSGIRVILDGNFLQISYPIPVICGSMDEDITYECYTMETILLRGLFYLGRTSITNVTQYCKDRGMPLPYLSETTIRQRMKIITISYPMGLNLEDTSLGRMHSRRLSHFISSWSFPGIWN